MLLNGMSTGRTNSPAKVEVTVNNGVRKGGGSSIGDSSGGGDHGLGNSSSLETVSEIGGGVALFWMEGRRD